MARSTVDTKAVDLAAAIVCLSDLFADFVKSSGVDLPDLDQRIANLQEICYGTVETKKQDQFGFTVAAINGVVSPADVGSESPAALSAADQTVQV